MLLIFISFILGRNDLNPITTDGPLLGDPSVEQEYLFLGLVSLANYL